MDCGKFANELRKYKNKLLCFKCYNKKTKKIIFPRKLLIPLDKALNKIYSVKGYVSKKGYIRAYCSFPGILIGKKFKIQLINQ